MDLTIICVTGPGSTGKSTIIRNFTAKYLKYERSKGDILGIFPMLRLHYPVGVTGSGDNIDFIISGRTFLSRYKGLKVMIVASRSEGETLHEVKRFAKKSGATLHLVQTHKLAKSAQRAEAVAANIVRIRRLMPKASVV